jgi:transcription elongation factor Elf1
MPQSEWVSDDASKVCQLCGTGFSFLSRRHHCRFCGRLACHDCASEAIPLGAERHRACLSCRQLGVRKQVTTKAMDPPVELLSNLSRFAMEKEIKPSYVPLLAKLAAYDVVVVCDDSGSMGEAASDDSPLTRWQELKQDVRMLLSALQWFGKPADFYFLNEGRCTDVRSYEQVAFMFDRDPSGATPIVRTLRNVWRDRHVSVGVERPLLVFLFTDGLPSGESLDDWIRRRPNPQSTFFSIVLCTDDDGIDAVYRRLECRVPGQYGWTGALQGAVGVDVTSDFRGELRDVRRARGSDFPFSRGDYMVKCLIGAIDPAVHAVDLPAGASIYS